MPGRTGTLSPQTPSRAQASRWGVRATSSSVLPPGSRGRPPRPSAMRRTMRVALSSRSSAIRLCRSIRSPLRPTPRQAGVYPGRNGKYSSAERIYDPCPRPAEGRRGSFLPPSRGRTMELPDEAISYNYQGLLVPSGEEWTAAAEMRARNFIPPQRFRELQQRPLQCRGQVAADREMRNVPAESLPLDAGFIDLPQQLLDGYRR